MDMGELARDYGCSALAATFQHGRIQQRLAPPEWLQTAATAAPATTSAAVWPATKVLPKMPGL